MLRVLTLLSVLALRPRRSAATPAAFREQLDNYDKRVIHSIKYLCMRPFGPRHIDEW